MVNEEDFEVFLEDFCDFLNGLESAVVKMKMQLAKLAVSAAENKFQWNPQLIRWEKAQGAKGEFERSSDVENSDFKELLKDLKAHNGKLTRNGYFYWLFSDGYTVGRKQRNAQREA
ncbi:MAG: hypothetical protein ACPLIG_00015 [Candidatus Bathyarchaeales archaeon]